MEQLIRDIRFGLRQLVKYPFFTLTATVAVGLGISSITTQLSVVNGLFLKGLPFPDSNKIVHLERVNLEREIYNREVPVLELIEWRRDQEVFEGLAGFYSGTANFTLGESVHRYNGSFISANSFELLRAKAALGRTLQPSDDLRESPDVVVLSHKAWNRDFGQDPEIVGKTAILNGRSVTIVGVMPEEFGFPVNEEIWVPLFKQQIPASLVWGSPTNMAIEVFGRLKPDVSLDQAHSAMTLVAKNLELAHPDTQKGFRDIRVRPFIEEYLSNETTAITAVMLLITALILVIACVNVANLLLARSMRRQKEIAIRSALGATRNRIIWQFLTESILLACLGSALGILLAHANIKKISNLTVEMNAPFWMDFSLDGTVLVVVILLTIATGLVSGLVPALRASKLNESDVLKDDTRTSSSLHMGKFSKALVILQISIAAVIMTLVILFVKSVDNAVSLNYEYDPDGVMSARIGLFEQAYPDEQARANFIDELLNRLRAHPEIELATTSHRYQFLQAPGIPYEMPDETYRDNTDRKFARFQLVSRDFFETIKLPIQQGRDFLPEEFSSDQPRQVIVNTAFAKREWPGENAIGKRFQPDLESVITGLENSDPVEVVGITGGMNEIGVFNPMNDDGAAFFLPQVPTSAPQFITIIVRGRGEPNDLLPILRGEVSALDRNLPIYTTGTPREINAQNTVQFRFFSSIFKNFGILATFLSAVGIYGIISFTVNQRIMEFGIRQALGATQATVFKLVYGHAFKQLGYGFLIAIVLLSPIILSPGIQESMAIFFYKIDHDSLMPYCLSFGFVTLISIISATPSAIKAARIHPAQALRYE